MNSRETHHRHTTAPGSQSAQRKKTETANIRAGKSLALDESSTSNKVASNLVAFRRGQWVTIDGSQALQQGVPYYAGDKAKINGSVYELGADRQTWKIANAEGENNEGAPSKVFRPVAPPKQTSGQALPSGLDFESVIKDIETGKSNAFDAITPKTHLRTFKYGDKTVTIGGLHDSVTQGDVVKAEEMIKTLMDKTGFGNAIKGAPKYVSKFYVGLGWYGKQPENATIYGINTGRNKPENYTVLDLNAIENYQRDVDAQTGELRMADLILHEMGGHGAYIGDVFTSDFENVAYGVANKWATEYALEKGYDVAKVFNPGLGGSNTASNYSNRFDYKEFNRNNK
ncbi:hypothetical protein [Veronia pacifica]|uniref:Uncharacterized protein n=1 Tax=Veronia pacifica TaxID=1080227 RepID=A0A1C3EKN3_9GAMM|nr:hypothetical protein [Veronia pacifica]ODA33796.1 hypothetical protein A8L45_09205 [Veronia pacifica]